jgi:hypothetical protein
MYTIIDGSMPVISNTESSAKPTVLIGFLV